MTKEEATKILKDFHDKSALFSVRTALETLCPELKEPDDREIKKALLNYMTKMWENSLDDVCGVHVGDVIAWLERQGEQKPTWTKEDDVRLQACIDCLQAESLMGKVDTVMTKWLESLKQRIGGKL